MQVDPITSKLKPPGTKRLKVKCDILLSNAGFKFNLSRYTKVAHWENQQRITSSAMASRRAENEVLLERTAAAAALLERRTVPGRGLHSSTSQLNLSRV